VRRSAAATCAVLALFAAVLPAQEELRWDGPTPPTVRLGDESQLQVIVQGKGVDPRPPEVPNIEGMQVQVLSRGSQTFMSFVNGRMTESHTVQYTVVLRPSRVGKFTIPPIKVFTGTRTQEIPELRIEAVKDLTGAENGYLDVTVEPQRVYVHQPVHVFVDFGADAGLRPVQEVASDQSGRAFRYVDFEVQAPWLSKMSSGVPIEVGNPPDGMTVVLNRTAQMAGYQANAQRAGKTWHRFWFEKAFLPTRAGTLELSAPMLRYNVLQGRSGMFGERSQTQNNYVYGKPIRIEVLPIPEAGRPNPYFGGVGRFQVEASLDRSSVKYGGSVKLTFTVRGDGNLEFLRVPDLDDLKGFHKRGQTEKRDQQHVTVVYDLAPLDPSVTEVPAIPFNWFDTTPGVEKFVEVSTKPLPLEVKPNEHGETLAPLAGTESRPVVPGVDDIFDLRPVDGAPMPAQHRPGMEWAWIAVVGPWLLALLLGFTARIRRARAADPLGRAARAAARNCEHALRSGSAPVDALVQYLADRLGVQPAAVIGPDLKVRLCDAGLAPDLAATTAQAVERGTAGRYGGGADLDAATVRALVRQLEPVSVQRAPVAVVVLALLASAGIARTQEPIRTAPEITTAGVPDVAAAVAAYRKGDYPTATSGFRAAAERTGDPRLWADLGNACYRNGDLPRAVWAWRCALRGLPRDDELRANLRLATRKLELGDGGGEPFLQAVAALRNRFTLGEVLLLTPVCQGAAALLLVLGFRRRLLRVLGFAGLVPALLLAFDVLWLEPRQPSEGIALVPVPVQAEPRGDLPPVATVRAGAALSVLGRSETWLRVEAGGRKGYARSDQVAEVR